MYKRMGLWIRDHTDPASTILCVGEIGTVAFYSERYLINEFSDMNLITESIANSSFRGKPIVGPLLGLNYYWRRTLPPLAPPQYRLQAARVDAAMKDGPAAPGSLMSWDVSTRFVQWSTPGRRMRYTLVPASERVVK
jgi:hypothetical protein